MEEARPEAPKACLTTRRRAGEGVRVVTRRRWVERAPGRLAALLALFLCGPAPAQPLATPEAAAAQASPSILWYNAPSRCAFFTPPEQVAFRAGDPDTWRLRFIIMASTPGESAEPLERGYVMKDGLLRELEKVRSGADAEGATVTVWRSAGEPRLNITTTLRTDGTERGQTRLRGTLATMRGDGRDLVDIVGACHE